MRWLPVAALLALSLTPSPAHAQEVACAVPARVEAPSADADLTRLRRFAAGEGVRVAVIDTGVTRHPRLPGLIAGGDYVSDKDGTEDCDSHGTVVAGLIAASPEPGDAFAGVAPDARIITIRQSSSAYQVAGRSEQQQEGQNADGYGNVGTLASAVRHAADMGATVIKVESPDGDDTRLWMPPERDGIGTYYLSVNRNKQSIALDLADPQDRKTAYAILDRADVFVENFKPGGMAKLGLGYDEIAEEVDVPVSTVRGQLARARSTLVRQLDGWR